MTYQITQLQQTQHPEIGVKVTEISENVVYPNCLEFFKECQNVADELNLPTHLQPIEHYYSTIKTYYKANLTPVQAVKKYFL